MPATVVMIPFAVHLADDVVEVGGDIEIACCIELQTGGAGKLCLDGRTAVTAKTPLSIARHRFDDESNSLQ